jgi:hypothetical protein
MISAFTACLVLFGEPRPKAVILSGCDSSRSDDSLYLRQRSRHSKSTHLAGRGARALHVPLAFLLHQVSSAAISVRAVRFMAGVALRPDGDPSVGCSEFTKTWWAWLLATGCCLACTLGCKMVGLFTFFTIGAAVLWDLWGILDIKRGHSMVSPLDEAPQQTRPFDSVFFAAQTGILHPPFRC